MRLVPDAIEPIDDYEPLSLRAERYSLRHQPQRPGELCDWLEFELSEKAAAHIRAHANVPAGLWLAIAIEAQRCLENLAEHPVTTGLNLIDRLDQAAEVRLATAVCRPPARLLKAYAKALRCGEAPLEELDSGRVALTPSTSAVTAWEHHARGRGTGLGEWVREVTESMPVGRLSWEAAAAERGQSLAEWISVNAHRSS